MSNQDYLAAAQLWHRRAAGLALKLNFHHWLTRLIPKLFVALVMLAIFELFRREVAGPARWSVALLLMALAFVMGWAWFQVRKHFCTWKQGLVRLETVLGLHNQLSAAEAGVVPWPDPSAKIHDGYAENWKFLLTPLLVGGLFLLMAHLIPVNRMKLGANSEPISEPPEFSQVQNWLNALKAEDLIEPDKLQETQTALNKLRERPAQDWYTQNNLEAANSLKELTEQSMNNLAHDLNQADHAVETMREKEENSGDSGSLQPMQDELRQAGDNLASGNLPLKRELVDQLRGGEGAHDKPLSAEQLKALHDRLQKGEQAAQTAPKLNGGFSEEMQKAMTDAGMGGNGQGPGSGRDGLGGPGSGGTGGGKETAPLELQSREGTTGPGKLTEVNNDDMSHAALGETLKVSAGEHPIDPTAYSGTQNAGAAQVQGSGGEAVWRSTYDPQEADTLARFFK